MTMYYSIADDIEKYPGAWCYAVVGGRNTGKTYGALTYHMDHNLKHVFVKRTNRDVGILCKGNKLGAKVGEWSIDFSPYKSVNRDRGSAIKAYELDDGIGAFYDTKEGAPTGSPVGYLLSLSSIVKYKGFDLSECFSIIFDEFIPRKGERISRSEGDDLMDLYKTVSRDRSERGLPELKLILLANAVNIYNPTFDTLELTDVVADMQSKGEEVRFLENRGILIRLLRTSEEMMQVESRTGIYRAMEGTAWAEMAFGNEFAYNDFSNIQNTSLKGYRCVAEILYKRKPIYIYRSGEQYYLCRSRGHPRHQYDLSREMDIRAFYLDYVIDLLNATTRGMCRYQEYSYYDIIVNYKKRFDVK